MTPLRLDEGGRELFALHLTPPLGRASGDAVVLCNPFGHEAIRAQRFYRVLGYRLAAAGLHVLRFDYHGSGDSGGEDADFDVHGAVADTVRAATELRRRSGVARLSLLGLRLGAQIAYMAAQALAAERLVLLEPLLDGELYLRQLEAAHQAELDMAFGPRWAREAALRAFNAGRDEALGFALTPRCREQMIAVLREPVRACCRSVLVLSDDAAVAARWGGIDGVRCIASASGVDWTTSDSLNATLVPPAWIELVLRELSPEPAHA